MAAKRSHHEDTIRKEAQRAKDAAAAALADAATVRPPSPRVAPTVFHMGRAHALPREVLIVAGGARAGGRSHMGNIGSVCLPPREKGRGKGPTSAM